MTRKHFIAIASMIKEYLGSTTTRGEANLIAAVARSLASEFSHINGAFKFDTFYRACGLQPDGFPEWVEVV